MTLHRSMMGAVAALTLSLTVTAGAEGETTTVPIPDFGSPESWQPNADGGHAASLEMDTANAWQGKPTLKVTYHNSPPHWGNSRLPVTVPPNALGLKLRVMKHSADSRAALHVWLFEKDGDGWVQRFKFGQEELADLSTGWHEVVLPVADFRFEPRGNKARNILSVDRMLLGCNYGDLCVSIADAHWVCLPDRSRTPMPKSDPLRVRTGRAGKAAIWFVPGASNAGAANVGAVTKALERAGWGVTQLKGGDLADPKALNTDNFDPLVLPNAPAFPAQAKVQLIAYLKAGGCMITMGGYAFDDLVCWTGEQWQPLSSGLTAVQMIKPQESLNINSRFGKPGDAMSLFPDAIAIFDPAYPLRNAHALRAATDQFIVEPETQFNAGGELAETTTEKPPRFRGHAAIALDDYGSAVFATRKARYVPLLDAVDESGRRCGPAGAMLLHFDGPYKGSSWAFFGLSNFDVFAQTGANSLNACLPKLAERLTRKVFICNFDPEYATYAPGEDVLVDLKVANLGRREAVCNVALAHDDELGLIAEPDKELAVQAGETATVRIRFRCSEGAQAGLRRMRVMLSHRGEPIDVMHAGVVIRDGRWSGSPIEFKDNYFRRNDRTQFLCGSNQTGIMYATPDENPLTWDTDFRTMADEGLRVLRILHFSAFSSREVIGLAKDPPEKLRRQMDAILWLALKHGVCIFLTLHDWMGVDLTDEELEAQAKWMRFWTERYREAPNIIYDVQNEPSVGLSEKPHVLALWNEWLANRYGSRDAAWRAWGQKGEPPERLNFKTIAPADKWRDLAEVDRQLFKVFMLNRWVKANVDGICAGDPDAIHTVGYLPWMHTADKILGARHVVFSNMHYYGRVEQLCLKFKLIDRRFEGKSLSIGEFGHREAHDIRTHGQDGTADEISICRFLLTTHYCFGLGGSMACNWDIKDMMGCVFPWGVNHADHVPKPIARAFRNMSLLLGMPTPKYRDPELYYIVPDGFRLGPEYHDILGALHKSLDELMKLRGDFNVINEESLGDMPPAASWAIWPLAYCASDEAFESARRFVERGGSLLVTGDFTVGATRKRDRRARAESLGLAVPPEHDPFKALPVPEGVAWRRVGKGRLLWYPCPLELTDGEQIRSVYERFLHESAVPLPEVDPPVKGLKVFRVPCSPTGEVMVLTTADGETRAVKVKTSAGWQACRIGGGVPALLWVEGERLVAREEPQRQVDGTMGHAAVVSLDGRDLSDSGSVAVIPFLPGRYGLPSAGGEHVVAPFDVYDHELRQLAEWKKASVGSGGELSVDLPEALDLLVICPPGDRERSIARLKQLLGVGSR